MPNTREDRKRLMVPARLRAHGALSDARIVDASSRGLSMTASRVPPRGEIVEVLLGRGVMVGQVRWSRGERFGVVLQNRIDVSALRSGEVIALGSGRASPSGTGAGEWSRNDILFVAAAVLAGSVFLFQAVRLLL